VANVLQYSANNKPPTKVYKYTGTTPNMDATTTITVPAGTTAVIITIDIMSTGVANSHTRTALLFNDNRGHLIYYGGNWGDTIEATLNGTTVTVTSTSPSPSGPRENILYVLAFTTEN